MSDQQGDFVYVVDAQNKAQQRRIQLGQSTPSTAVVTSGLKEGELVISEGLQRVRPGDPVSPGPASPPPTILPEDARGGASGAPADGAGPSSPTSGPNPPPPPHPSAESRFSQMAEMSLLRRRKIEDMTI